MFTGIIENIGKVTGVEKKGSNLDLWVESTLTGELKIDQSVAHNGICLTVVEKQDNQYRVTAVRETIEKTTIGNWEAGQMVNLERGMRLNDRLDGHIVQGHVDSTAELFEVSAFNGSHLLTFKYPKEFASLIIPKGSICINGVSLTVIDPSIDRFQVTIIPFTWEHTNFQHLAAGDPVNIEFDILGKYILRRSEVDLLSRG